MKFALGKLILLLVGCSPAPTASLHHRKLVAAHPKANVVPGTFIVQLHLSSVSDVRGRAVELLQDIEGVKVTYVFDDVTFFQGFTVQFPASSPEDTDRWLELLLDQEEVLDARYEQRLSGAADNGDVAASNGPFTTPDHHHRGLRANSNVRDLASPQINPPCQLDVIDQRNPTAPDGIYKYNYTGKGVNVYIQDYSGLRTTHQDFGGRAKCGYDLGFLGFLGLFSDNCAPNGSIGTFMGGLIGGTVSGVAKEANLIGVQNGDLFSGYLFMFLWLKGERAANPDTPMVLVSNTFRGNNLFSFIDDFIISSSIEQLWQAGVVSVFEAPVVEDGGCANSFGQYIESVITVGMTDCNATNAKVVFDDFTLTGASGDCIDVFAPGDSVTSSFWQGDDQFDSRAGPAYATAMVAGVVALYLEAHPDWTPDQIKAALLADATPGVVTGAGEGSPDRFLYVGV